MGTMTIAPPAGQYASESAWTGRIPPKIRSLSIRRASGRAWNTIGASDSEIAAALGIDRRNAGRRRAGETGPIAGACEEVYLLEKAGISTHALTAHLKSLAMQARMREVPTERLLVRLDELQIEEAEATGQLRIAQIQYRSAQPALRRQHRQELSSLAARVAAVAEETVAICDELDERERRR